MSVKQYILHLCEAYGVKIRKKLGQNFLINPLIYEMEIQAADLQPNDIVMDIGAGFGFLTERLAQKSKKVYAVEIDERISRALEDRMKQLKILDKVEIIKADVLRIKFPDDLTKIVSNPPYYISSDLIVKIIKELNNKEQFKKVVLILQYDFVQRLIAKPCSDNWGRISALFNYYTIPRYLRKISKRNFYPIPEVDSALIEFQFKRESLIPVEKFEKISDMVFQGSNKTLRRLLKRYLKPLTPDWKKIIEKLGNTVNVEKRVRCVTPEDLEKIVLKMRELDVPV